jgi:hypothetical protein
MIRQDFIAWLPPWVLGAAFLAGMLSAAEVGRRIGSWHARRSGGTFELGTILGGVLGVLGLLIGFTYAFAAERSDRRKTFIVEEANAIGTAYLRSGLAPEPVRAELEETLREYVASRLVRDALFHDPNEAAKAITRSEEVQAKLWPLALRSLEGREPNAADALLLASINEVIDMHGRRLAAGRDHIPGIILSMLFLVSLASLGLCGFAGGAAQRRGFFLTATLALLVALVVTLVIDLDSPRGGFLRISQQSLIDVDRSMRPDGGGPAAGAPDPGKGR